MDRDTAVRMAQEAIRAKNKQLVDAVLKLKEKQENDPMPPKSVSELPLIGVTCSTGWECYAIVAELVKTGKFRIRAMFRTKGTAASQRLETLWTNVEAKTPGLLELRAGVDLTKPEVLTDAFSGCDGIVLYLTANASKAGKFKFHGNDAIHGRIAFMEQVLASLTALKANPAIGHVITLVFPTDKVTDMADASPTIPWWIGQRLRLSDFLRGQGINVTCIHRPAYYFAMHRVDYNRTAHERGDSKMSKTMIKEDYVPGINDAEYMVNWVDVRDVGKWCGTVFEYPEVFSNVDFSIASCCMTGQEAAEIATKVNKHGTTFKYRPFPRFVMRMLSCFYSEVVYPLKTAEWYNDKANGYDFASNQDLVDLDRIHPRWTFEKKLVDWGIDDILPHTKGRAT